MLTLDGKVALITGATRGIGKETACLFAQHGAELVLNGRNLDSLNELSDYIEKEFGQKPLCIPYDVSNIDGVKGAFQTINSRYKKLDVLVNNAGILEDALLGMISPDQLQNTLSINLNGTIYHMQYAARLMKKNNAGSIINVSSIIGRVGNAGQVAYAASKSGVIGATLSAAKELASQNIRVNAVAPGFIETDMARQLTDAKYQERLHSIAMGRIGKPQEVASVSLFLASEMSTYVTGQVIGVDGGMLI